VRLWNARKPYRGRDFAPDSTKGADSVPAADEASPLMRNRRLGPSLAYGRISADADLLFAQTPLLRLVVDLLYKRVVRTTNPQPIEVMEFAQ